MAKGCGSCTVTTTASDATLVSATRRQSGILLFHLCSCHNPPPPILNAHTSTHTNTHSLEHCQSKASPLVQRPLEGTRSMHHRVPAMGVVAAAATAVAPAATAAAAETAAATALVACRVATNCSCLNPTHMSTAPLPARAHPRWPMDAC